MGRLRLGLVGLTLALGCSGGEREVVVTRDRFPGPWPLAVNSAVVICREGGELVLLKLGTRRYALSDAAQAAGYETPPTLPGADAGPLRGACAPSVAARP